MAVADLMLEALEKIGYSFVRDSSLWWYLAPVLLLWFLLELYFGEHKSEQLGWNTALGNGITLTWISIESMRFLFESNPPNFWVRFGIIVGIMFYSLMIVYISFTHKISAKLTYALASPSTVYYLSIVTILWGHGALIINGWVFVDLVILFILSLVFFAILRKIIPDSVKDFGEKAFMGDSFGSDLGLDSKKDKSGKLDLDIDKELKKLKL